jgi:serine/threonine-protein kinase
VLLLVGVALVFMVPFVRNGLKASPTAPMARVPDLTGMTVPEARSLAGSRGFQVIVIGDRVTDRDPRDRIVQQSPIAGWEASDQPIRVTVSAGVRVPDVRGKSLENATAALTELGWRVARVERGSFPGQPSGTVVLQSPAPNEVAPGPGELLLAIAQ